MKILINDKLDDKLRKELIKLNHEVDEKHYNNEELFERILQYECIIVRSATKIRSKLIDIAKKGKLKLIIRAGVGLDNIDVDYAKKNGIAVLNTPEASTNAVAELTMAHILSLFKGIYIYNVDFRDGKYNNTKYKPIDLKDKTIGIIGFGRIGQKVAEKAYSLGMKVIYFTRSGEKENLPNFKYTSYEKLLASSDVITLHVPYIKGHGPFIRKDEYKLIKDGAFLINAARGGVISEDDLIEEINRGKISGAALDVFESEPLTNKKIIKSRKISLSPHIGGSTKESQNRITEEILEIIKSKV